MTPNIKMIDGFLSQEECASIVFFLEKIDEWERLPDPANWWDNRSLSDYTIYTNFDKNLGLRLVEIKQKIANIIKEHYQEESIYPDLLSISRWFPGMEQLPHADDMTNALSNEDNWHKHRAFGSVIYLNNNYSGGETFYPDHNIVVTPKVGTLVIHPANTNHLHGVTKIDGATRYTISSFWTKDKTKFYNWEANII